MTAQPFSGVLVRGSRRPILNIMRRRRGLGQPNAPGCMSGSDFLAAIGGQPSCDPRDTACVLCNTQKGDAASNFVDSGCVAPGTPVSFSCDTSANAIAAFQNNSPLVVNATVGTGANAFVASGPALTVAPPSQTSAPSFGSGTVSNNPPPFSVATQQQQANPLAQQMTLTTSTPPLYPFSPHPPMPTIVNPSPGSQSTAGSTSAMNPNSALSQANGSWLTDSTQDVITGLPNWALLALGAAGLFMVITLAQRR